MATTTSRTKHTLLPTLSFLTLLLSGCTKYAPAGFWQGYAQEAIFRNKTDQGPWGGSRSIHWRMKRNRTLSIDQVLIFARDNHWELVDSTHYSADDMEGWRSDNMPVFPARLDGFKPVDDDVPDVHEFPRWIKTDLTVYRFKTGWLLYNSGTDNATEINGFVLMSSDRKEMTVYHLWGE
jgi:hypothetical protein